MKSVDNEIIVEDFPKFNEVSMHSRVFHQMPSISNSLEATHGHLNHALPRNHDFWRSVFHLYEELSMKYAMTNDRIQHNYNSRIRKMNSRIDIEMHRHITFYHTTIHHCDCSENKLESANYNIDIPCSHRLFLGAEFPNLPELIIQQNLQYDQLEIEIDIEQTVELFQSNDYFSLEKEFIFRTIKRFCKSKKDDEIRNYINSEYKDFEQRESYYINNQEVSIIQLFENGIYIFKDVPGLSYFGLQKSFMNYIFYLFII